MKLKLAEGVYNCMRCAIGQLLAPRAFGQKECVVRAFVVTRTGLSFIHVFLFGPVKPLGEPRVLLEEYTFKCRIINGGWVLNITICYNI